MPETVKDNDYSKELHKFIQQQKKKAFVRISTRKALALKKVPLYYKVSDTEWELYKPADTLISDIRLKEERHPVLYVLARDKAEAAVEAQQKIKEQLKSDLKNGDMQLVRDGMVEITDELLEEPRSGTYREAEKTIKLVLTAFTRKESILGQMLSIAAKDYTTALHSVNVMTLMLGFCKFVGYDWKRTLQFSMAALLHDVGKTLIPNEILCSPSKLSSDEFRVMQMHPRVGVDLLMRNGIRDTKVIQAAAEHHEKVNGSGYPKHIKDVSLIGQLVSIIDIYEALTNNERPYRRAMPPKEALKILHEENDKGAFVYGLVDRFILSLNDPRM